MLLLGRKSRSALIFQSSRLRFRSKVSDAGNRIAMSHGAAEFFCRDFFRRDRFDDRRAGENMLDVFLTMNQVIKAGL